MNYGAAYRYILLSVDTVCLTNSECLFCTEPRRVSVTEGTDITLQCSHHSRESDVPRWSRESAGRQQQHTRCRISTVDKTLTVTEVKLGDSGLYYCDGRPAVYLTVRGEKRGCRLRRITLSHKRYIYRVCL